MARRHGDCGVVHTVDTAAHGWGAGLELPQDLGLCWALQEAVCAGRGGSRQRGPLPRGGGTVGRAVSSSKLILGTLLPSVAWVVPRLQPLAPSVTPPGGRHNSWALRRLPGWQDWPQSRDWNGVKGTARARSVGSGGLPHGMPIPDGERC